MDTPPQTASLMPVVEVLNTSASHGDEATSTDGPVVERRCRLVAEVAVDRRSEDRLVEGGAGRLHWAWLAVGEGLVGEGLVREGLRGADRLTDGWLAWHTGSGADVEAGVPGRRKRRTLSGGRTLYGQEEARRP